MVEICTSQSISLRNTTVEVRLLEKGCTDIPLYTFTVAANAALGDISLDVTSDTDTDIKAGTGLAFLDGNDRIHVLVTQDATVTTVGTTLEVSPLEFDINAAATASFYEGLLPLSGIQDFTFNTSTQEVDTTTVRSGTNMESELVRSDKTIDFSGVIVKGDAGLFLVVKRVAEDTAFFGRPVLMVFTLPDGERRAGAVLIKNYSEAGNQNEVRRYSFTAQFQGDSYLREDPEIITV